MNENIPNEERGGGNKKKINKKTLKTTLLWTSRSVQGTKENCYFGLQVSVSNPNFLCTPYASTCPWKHSFKGFFINFFIYVFLLIKNP